MGIEWAVVLVFAVLAFAGWLAYLYTKMQAAMFEKQGRDTAAFFEKQTHDAFAFFDKEARESRSWMTALTDSMLSTTERILSPPAPVDTDTYHDEPVESDYGRVVFSKTKTNSSEEDE